MSVLIIALILLTAILWLWALADILRAKFETSTIKLLWIFLILIFPIIGSIVYFQFGKNFIQKRKKFNPTLNK